MKKKILLPLLLLCVGSLATTTACDGVNIPFLDDLPFFNSEQPKEEVVTLNKDSVEIEVYEELTLSAAYDGEETLVWTVADPTIVSVENGKLVGLKAGTTTVTVTAGSATDSCTVTVKALDTSKLSLEVAEPNVSLHKGDEAQISATVKYNGTALDVAAEKSYESTDPEIASVDENGLIKAENFGGATIVVTYTVGGSNISTVVNVSVLSGGKVEIEQSSIELDYQGEPVTLKATAYEDNEEQTDATITWSATEGQDVIEINGNVITAKNAGETEVTATYVDSEGQSRTDTVTVTVLRIDVDKTADTTVQGSSYKGEQEYELNPSELGLEGEVTGAYIMKGDIEKDIPYVDGKLNFSVITAGDWELYLETRNITYKVNLALEGPIYLNNENFAELLQADSTDSDALFNLEEDIDLTDVTWTTSASFSATFDGDGYTIKGLSVSENSGLFSVLKDATIKNVSVIDAVLSGKDSGVFAATTEGAVTFENVYVSIAGTAFGEYYAQEHEKDFVLDNAYGKGGLVGQSTNAVTVKNSVIYMPENLTKANGFVAGSANSTITLENSTFIGGNGLIYGTRSDYVATVTKDDNTTVCDAVAAHKALNQKETTALTDAEKAYQANHPYVELNQENIANLATMTNQIVVLTSDVALPLTKTENEIEIKTTSLGTNNSIAFTGVFDGQDHKITGLDLADKNNGLFYYLEGSVKNVALQGTVQQNGGMVAMNARSTAYIENVFVDATFKSATSGGLVYRMSGVASLSIKDAVISITSTASATNKVKNGAILGYGVALATGSMGIYMENCSYTWNNNGEQAIGRRDKADALSSYDNNHKYFFWDIDDNHTTDDGLTCYDTLGLLKTGEKDLTEFLNGMLADVEAEIPSNEPILLTQANFETYFKVTTTIKGYYVLTEDIDLGGKYYGVSGNVFSGTLDGQGYTISGIDMNKNAHSGGLFYCLNGIVKNVRIEGAMTATGTTTGYGLIANRVEVGNSATLENVYIEYTGPHHTSKATHSSPTFRYVYGTLTMRNVVAYCTDANQAGGGGLVGALMSGTSTTAASKTTFENCYSITTNATINAISTAQTAEPLPVQNGKPTEYKGETAKADFDAAVTAGTVTLTDELKALMYPTTED